VTPAKLLAFAALAFPALSIAAEPASAPRVLTTAQVLESAQASDWRQPDPANTLYMDLAAGRVVIELAPRFAPQHVANIRQLVSEKFFDGLPVMRVQDNYVVQWGDVDETRKTVAAQRKLPDESVTPWSAALPFVKLPDTDGYAPATGWLDGFPTGVDPWPPGQAWLTHCYGTVGVGRDSPPDTGAGTQLYVVIGQAPRHLDRNIVTVGRILRGIELLSSLPRGTGALGFYENPKQRTPIKSIRIAADLPPAKRTALEVLRTDTPLWLQYVESRRNRREDWFLRPSNHIDVCNITIPVRDAPSH
jgi:peptidylprolyl isomerase